MYKYFNTVAYHDNNEIILYQNRIRWKIKVIEKILTFTNEQTYKNTRYNEDNIYKISII
jgi:hypothetical protein